MYNIFTTEKKKKSSNEEGAIFKMFDHARKVP